MVMMPPNVRPPGAPARPPGVPPGPGMPPGPGAPGAGPGPEPAMLAALKMAMPMIQRIAETLSPEDVQRIMANGGMPGGPGPMRRRPPVGMPMGRPPMGPGGPGGPGGPRGPGGPARRPTPIAARPPARGRTAAPVRRAAPRVAPRAAPRRR
jgi:hypothetical protein